MLGKELKFCPYCAGRFETRMAEGRRRLVCTSCGEVYYQNPLPAATVLVLNDRCELLLGKRAVEPARGQWCLPGGFVELGESMEQAALRELQEETGLAADRGSFIGCFYQNSLYYGGVIIFGYRIDMVNGIPRAGDDMQELRYYPFDNLPPIAFESHRRLIELFKQQLSGSSYPAECCSC
jgi:ADP-ribose pyrophosphatase YjhB (NUDIX family)